MPSPDERPAARPRPDYGLPGPTASGQSANSSGRERPSYGLPGNGPGPSGAPASGPAGSPAPGSPNPGGGQYGGRPENQYGGQYGNQQGSGGGYGPAGDAPSAPFGAQGPEGFAPSGYVMPGAGSSGPGGPGGAAAPRRRGKLPLILGIVLIVVALIVAIIGVILGFRNIAGAIGDGPQTISEGSTDVKLQELEMVIVYVPAKDASDATCTASSPEDAVVESPAGGQEITFPNGDSYAQSIGAVATADTTVTLDCKGTTSADAAYIGPINPMGMLVPLIGAPMLGFLIGLVGLVLTIVGIVLMVRSRRA